MNNFRLVIFGVTNNTILVVKQTGPFLLIFKHRHRQNNFLSNVVCNFSNPEVRLAIVLPDSILGNPGLGYIRHWLIERTRIIASVDLHEDAFQPGNGTQTSVLILQKKSEEEIISEKLSGIKPYNIFMAVVEKVGHDKRGNTLFKRDEQGNEIWVSEDPDVPEMGEIAESEFTYETRKQSPHH